MKHLAKSLVTDQERVVLASDKLGIESCMIAVLNIAAGGVAKLEADSERLLLVLSGAISAQGNDGSTKLGAYDYLWQPAGRIDVTAIESARLLEIVIPDGKSTGVRVTGHLDVNSFNPHQGHAAEGHSFDTYTLVDNKCGASARIFAASVHPGSGMGLHFHPFDQFYFMLAGELQYQVGTAGSLAEPGDLIIFPAGTAHRNWNDSPEMALEITINIPEFVPDSKNVYHLDVVEK